MALDEGDGLVCRSAGAPDFPDRMRRATGRTLHVPTLAERLRWHGETAISCANVSPGAAYFQDPDGFGHVFHRSGSYGPGKQPVAPDERLDVTVGISGDMQMAERFCREVVPSGGPALGVLWLSEPDWSAHGSALGSPQHVSGLRAADGCVSRVLAALDDDGYPGSGDDMLLIVFIFPCQSKIKSLCRKWNLKFYCNTAIIRNFAVE